MGVGDLQRVQELLHLLPEKASDELLRDSLVALFAHSPGEQERCRQLFAQAQREAAAMATPDPLQGDPILREDRRDLRRLLMQIGTILLVPLLFLLAWFITPDEVTISLHERQLLLVNGTTTELPETDSLPEIGQVMAFELPEAGGQQAPALGRLDTTGGPLAFTALQEGEDAFTVRLLGTEDRVAVIPYRVTIQPDTTKEAGTQVQGADEITEVGQLSPLPLPHPRTLADAAPPVVAASVFTRLLYHWWWPLVLLTCGALLVALFLYLRYEERHKIRLVAQREQADGAPHFWRVDLPQLRAVIDWGEGYPGLVRQLRRRREDDHQEIDLPQTIKATVDGGGLPTFRFRSVTRPAEYLLLIDRGTADNHQARLFEALYQQLLAEEVLIDRYFYNGDPRLLYQHDRSQTTRLVQLQRRYPTARLFLVGSGDRLLNAASGKLAKWVPEQLGGWSTRCLLSTLPTNDWGRRERQLDTFLTVLPASMQGLQLLVQRLNDGDTDADKPDYRALVSDAARETVVLRADQTFMESLREVYSEQKLKWLAACALYPALHWDLTLFLGKTVGDYLQEPLLSSTNLLSLSRLPWFASGSMPEAARTELAEWLRGEHPALHDHLRQAILGLLETADLPPVGSAARRDLDFYRLQNDWLLTAPGTPERARLAEELAQRIANGEEPDTTVVRVMEQPKASDLTLPASWNERLYPGGFPGFGLKSIWRKFLVESQGVWLLLLLAFIFQPEAPEIDSSCSGPTSQLMVRDTLNYGQDSLIAIKLCDRLDTMALAEYIWQDRIKRVDWVDSLNKISFNAQVLPTFYGEEVRATAIPGVSKTLRALREEPSPDSLLETHRQNVGVMLFNRGISLLEENPDAAEQACGFFTAGIDLTEIPVRYLAFLTEYCRAERWQEQGLAPGPEQRPQGNQQEDDRQTPATDPALLNQGRRAIITLEGLQKRLNARFAGGLVARPVLRLIENRIASLRKKVNDGTLQQEDLREYERLRDQGELLLMGGEEPPETGQELPQSVPQETSPAPAAPPKIIRVTLVRLVCEKSDEGPGGSAEIDRLGFFLNARQQKCAGDNPTQVLARQLSIYSYNGEPVEVRRGEVWQDTNQAVEITLSEESCRSLELTVAVSAREHDAASSSDAVNATYEIPINQGYGDFNWRLRSEQFIFKCEFRVEKVGDW